MHDCRRTPNAGCRFGLFWRSKDGHQVSRNCSWYARCRQFNPEKSWARYNSYEPSKKRRREILSKLRFNNDVIVAFCIQSDTDNIIKEVRKRKPKSRLPTRRIVYVHDQGVYRYFYDAAAEFFVRHRHDVRKVIFQRDSDCASFTKTNGLLGNVEDGDAYKLADIVAWSNTNRREPEGVVVGDLRDILRRKALKRFG